MSNFQDKAKLIWDTAELLRGDYKPADYGKVILPMTVIRRLDSVLESTKDEVQVRYKSMTEPLTVLNQRILTKLANAPFYNTSPFTMRRLKDSPGILTDNLRSYIQGFSANVRDIIGYFDFDTQIQKLQDANLLYLVVDRFSEVDLHPATVSNMDMGYIFEELIRRFNEQSNETAGDHFTPREVIRLMVNILFDADDEALTKPHITRKIFDPACGTGGMLSISHERLKELNSTMNVEVYGQEINPESYAICKSDMLLQDLNADNIKFGNSFTQDGLQNEQFHYMLSNPPFGVDWKKVQSEIQTEYEKLGFNGRFGAGLPRVSDGSLLFLQHMISKMKVGEGRIAMVLNGSPLFTGGAGSGESEIRRWIIENDWLEAIVALPTELFYNTGIATYIWIVSNHKSGDRTGRIQLINATVFSQKMRKSLGNKRNELSQEHIDKIVEMYSYFKNEENSKIFDNEDFGYRRITIERPLRLRFEVSDSGVETLQANKGFGKLDTSEQKKILGALASLRNGKPMFNRQEATDRLKVAFNYESVSVKPAILKVIVDSFCERDESAEICLDGKGKPESDADLRDFENVPLKEDIYEYFEREVKPHVPDAWINEDIRDDKDGQIGKVGYEISFTRHFYKFEEMRSASDIATEIRELEKKIVEKMKGLFV